MEEGLCTRAAAKDLIVITVFVRGPPRFGVSELCEPGGLVGLAVGFGWELGVVTWLDRRRAGPAWTAGLIWI